MWKVFKLVNSALSECYVGVTQGDPQAGLREASDGEIEIIDYWDGEEHRIRLESVEEFLSAEAAEVRLQALSLQNGCKKSP